MMQQRPVNERQFEVLRWVGEGCPAKDWADQTYKLTARALAGRGLVTVRKRSGVWTCTITDIGQYYLAHGEYPALEETSSNKTGKTQRRRAPRPSKPKNPVPPSPKLPSRAPNPTP